jgi:ATP sulfurylase
MSNELKIGSKSFVLDDPKGALGRITPEERKEQHQEHTSSDTIVSVLRPELRPPAPMDRPEFHRHLRAALRVAPLKLYW